CSATNRMKGRIASPKNVTELGQRDFCRGSRSSRQGPKTPRDRFVDDSALEEAGFEPFGPAPAKGSSGRCQSETAARKVESLTGSGPKRHDPIRADVAVEDGRIAAIGEVGKDASEIVDEAGSR